MPPFTATGPAEVKHLVDFVTRLIKGNFQQDPQDKRKQIFDKPLLTGMDNFFSGNVVLNYLEE